MNMAGEIGDSRNSVRSKPPAGNPETLGELLHFAASLYGNQPAYTFLPFGEREDGVLSFGELHRTATELSGVLSEHARAGERAILAYPAGLAFIPALLACAMAGVIAVPVVPPGPGRPPRHLARLVSIIEDSSPTLGLTTSSLLPGLARHAQETPALQQLTWLATETLPTGMQPSPGRTAQPHTPVLLQYTSGSTKAPRGVIISHQNLLHNLRLARLAFEFRDQQPESVVSWLPHYHDMGLGTILQPLLSGCSLILMPPMAFVQKPIRWLQAISAHRAEISGGPNFGYDLCVERTRPEERAALDLRSWSVAFTGAEPVRRDTLERFTESFAPWGFQRIAFYPCYGLAESTLIVTGGSRGLGPNYLSVDSSRLEQHAVVRASGPSAAVLVGCGRPLGDTQIAIVDPLTRRSCGAGQVGEIWVSGASAARGYWNPQHSDDVFGATLAERPGEHFVRTGDLGFVDAGHLFITGRLKDMIIVRGSNHYPQDIEQTVERCDPAVRLGGVCAFSVDQDGQEHLALVVEVDPRLGGRAPGTPPQIAVPSTDIERRILEVVSTHHDLRVHSMRLVVPGRLPRTPSGKLQRQACREMFFGHLSQTGSRRSVNRV
ncbi:fatty acyl-AMP ligase [Myxococcota bacterium]